MDPNDSNLQHVVSISAFCMRNTDQGKMYQFQYQCDGYCCWHYIDRIHLLCYYYHRYLILLLLLVLLTVSTVAKILNGLLPSLHYT
jgi:hypothetical protein